jgi:transposase
MKRFVEGEDRTQGGLLPEFLDDYVAEDDPVREGGFLCRAVAQRFGVNASSAIRWRAMEGREGDVRPKRQRGERHSQRIEAHVELILSAVAAKSDMTLSELRERLKERGVAVAIGTIWRFFKRHKITRKKKSAHAAEQRVLSICSATEIGTAGLSLLVGNEPVIATQMMHGSLMRRAPARSSTRRS